MKKEQKLPPDPKPKPDEWSGANAERNGIYPPDPKPKPRWNGRAVRNLAPRRNGRAVRNLAPRRAQQKKQKIKMK